MKNQLGLIGFIRNVKCSELETVSSEASYFSFNPNCINLESI